jgi:hypothetical protein
MIFGDEQYKFRSDLAVCHWNENVDRGYTSIWKPNNPNAPATQKGKKVYKQLTYNYRQNIWNQTSTEHINSTSHWQIMFVEKLINND